MTSLTQGFLCSLQSPFLYLPGTPHSLSPTHKATHQGCLSVPLRNCLILLGLGISHVNVEVLEVAKVHLALMPMSFSKDPK